MNNAKLTENILSEELQTDIEPMLRARQEKVAKIIEAVDSLSHSNHWKIVEGVFGELLNSSVNQLCVEKDNQKRDYLQGKIDILNKYADFKRFSEVYRLELKSIEEKLKRS